MINGFEVMARVLWIMNGVVVGTILSLGEAFQGESLLIAHVVVATILIGVHFSVVYVFSLLVKLREKLKEQYN